MPLTLGGRNKSICTLRLAVMGKNRPSRDIEFIISFVPSLLDRCYEPKWRPQAVTDTWKALQMGSIKDGVAARPFRSLEEVGGRLRFLLSTAKQQKAKIKKILNTKRNKKGILPHMTDKELEEDVIEVVGITSFFLPSKPEDIPLPLVDKVFL